jgi:multidrug efflux pump subunit AcrB
MKLIKSLFVIAGITALASCAKPSEKAAGTYNGTAVVNSTSYSGTSIVTANGDNKVNIQTTANSVTYTVNDVNVSLSNDVASFTYTSSTTTSGAVTALTGNVTGNNITLAYTIMLANPITYPIAFTGSK